MTYHAYDRDELKPASSVRVEHIIYENVEETDISSLIKLPLQDLIDAREDSVAAEQEVFYRMQDLAEKWEKQAGITLLYDAAIEYLKVPSATHTSNQWVQSDYRFTRSNAVYQMSYSISENTRYDSELQRSIPYSYTLYWSIYTNAPKTYHQIKVAGQDRKIFQTMEALNKYLNGRIKAYQHLFSEIYPAIPEEYAGCFKVNGILLPGYRISNQ